MFHFVMEDASEDVPLPTNSFYIQDGNAPFHALNNLPSTSGTICLKVLDEMVVKKNFVFSTDSYHADSIKCH